MPPREWGRRGALTAGRGTGFVMNGTWRRGRGRGLADVRLPQAGFGDTTTSGSWPRRFLAPLRIRSGDTRETAGCGVGRLKGTKRAGALVQVAPEASVR